MHAGLSCTHALDGLEPDRHVIYKQEKSATEGQRKPATCNNAAIGKDPRGYSCSIWFPDLNENKDH